MRTLLGANVGMFLVSMLFPAVPLALMLVPALIPERPWTVVTYMFLHAGLWHLVFNMLALYFFGPRLEARLGGPHFLALYGISGLVGAVMSLLTPTAAIVGASGAIFGVMLGYARYWPRALIYVWGIVPLEARWFVIVMTALSLLGGFGGVQPGVAHFTHLGGFVGGFAYLSWLDRRSPAAQFRASAVQPARSFDTSSAALARWAKIPLERLHPVNREEVARLLQKVSTSGMASLTPDERAVLDRFSP
ncbi:MAG TPA: rhomboid family intramembrane serine protease [Gemmatimonadales bacterium]|nr:rhomboid family intramembrane serine protease [Gemmatimonadales bacterium]